LGKHIIGLLLLYGRLLEVLLTDHGVVLEGGLLVGLLSVLDLCVSETEQLSELSLTLFIHFLLRLLAEDVEAVSLEGVEHCWARPSCEVAALSDACSVGIGRDVGSVGVARHSSEAASHHWVHSHAHAWHVHVGRVWIGEVVHSHAWHSSEAHAPSHASCELVHHWVAEARHLVSLELVSHCATLAHLGVVALV
jgi:hypothetical protein